MSMTPRIPPVNMNLGISPQERANAVQRQAQYSGAAQSSALQSKMKAEQDRVQAATDGYAHEQKGLGRAPAVGALPKPPDAQDNADQERRRRRRDTRPPWLRQPPKR